MLKSLHWECVCMSVYLFNYGYELAKYTNGRFNILTIKFSGLGRSVREKCYEL